MAEPTADPGADLPGSTVRRMPLRGGACVQVSSMADLEVQSPFLDTKVVIGCQDLMVGFHLPMYHPLRLGAHQPLLSCVRVGIGE